MLSSRRTGRSRTMKSQNSKDPPPEVKEAIHLARDQLQPVILSHAVWPPEDGSTEASAASWGLLRVYLLEVVRMHSHSHGEDDEDDDDDSDDGDDADAGGDDGAEDDDPGLFLVDFRRSFPTWLSWASTAAPTLLSWSCRCEEEVVPAKTRRNRRPRPRPQALHTQDRKASKPRLARSGSLGPRCLLGSPPGA